MMLQRTITALILVFIVALCLFAFSSPFPMYALMLAIAGIGAYEWRQFLQPASSGVAPNPAVTYALIAGVLALSIAALFVWFPFISVGLWTISAVAWLFAVNWVTSYPTVGIWANPWLTRLLALVMIPAAVTAIFYMWQQSAWWLMYVFALVWIADSGAYLVGRKLGRRKLMPQVSPGKSIEGMLGGLFCCALFIVGITFFKLQLTGLPAVVFVALSLVVVVFSVLGDLFESMFKRHVGIKDSGTLLPGHGGVLDRVDSLLAAAPLFALGYYFLAKDVICLVK